VAERDTHPMIEKLRAKRERHVERNLFYRFAFALVGILLILFGLLLSIPGVPGPGLLVVALGLGMLALEWDPAERLLERILYRLEDVREASRPVQIAIVAGAIVLGAGAFALTVVMWDVSVLPF
jgi:multisubunit Na+/H+ antiporter MnhB subunit